jgi:hypothetical protein
MFIMDMPDLPPQYAQVMIVQASQAQRNTDKIDRTIGVCSLVENPVRMEGNQYSAINGITPVVAVQVYFQNTENLLGPGFVTVLRSPQHGTLEPTSSDPKDGSYWYLPKPDYFGPDRATFLVEMGGKKIKMEYFFQVLHGVADDYNEKQFKQLCPNGKRWKISLSSDLDSDPLASQSPAQGGSFLTGAVPDVNVSIADLAGGAVGQTTANTVTLDTDAAGYGWFVDATPHNNEEFIRTSNPNEWVAKPGSAAEGKMDMLTVLLHEYGHVLGVNHDADGHDLMSESLKPGVRRTLSAEAYTQLWSALGDVT